MRTLISVTLLALAMSSCSSSDTAAPSAETVTATVTESAEPAEIITVTPEPPTSSNLKPLCDDFRDAVIDLKPRDAIDNGIALEDAVRAELDPGSGQYFAMMAVVGALFAVGLAEEGVGSPARTQDHLLDVGATILTSCEA